MVEADLASRYGRRRDAMRTLGLVRFDPWLWPAAVRLGRLASSLSTVPHRTVQAKPLILRPGGMGDLILLCVAAEELGIDKSDFRWVIETRSAPWARHLGLDHVCYDEALLGTHWRAAGRYPLVINTEQRFGLSQATALAARAGGGRVVSFDTNVAAAWSDEVVRYDPFEAHESVEFGRLLAAALRLQKPVVIRARRRRAPPTDRPVVGLGGLQSDSRRLSEETWFEITSRWSGGRPIYITAAPLDRPFARRLADRLGASVELFEGDFDAVCELVRRSSDVLTIDSGFLHIASYYGVPVTSIFTSSREKKWASLSPGSSLIRRDDLACQPCALYAQVPKCRYDFACTRVDFVSHCRSYELPDGCQDG